VAGCCEYGDEPSGSGATELVTSRIGQDVGGGPPIVLHWPNRKVGQRRGTMGK
jgi:hypothetical protein